jgi:two-component system phosphate regulon response regulator PhoB
VHSRLQLLDRIWGGQADIALRTVDVHIKRLRQCLAPAGCSHLIETVRGVGYRLSALATAPQAHEEQALS